MFAVALDPREMNVTGEHVIPAAMRPEEKLLIGAQTPESLQGPLSLRTPS
jgi:hypothetical protein